MGDTERQALGRWGERLAERYLLDQGMRVVDRNWRCRHGEIDIVAVDGDCLVVCEVKTRSDTRFGDAVEAVTWHKYARLRRLAGAWMTSHDTGPMPVRIDVIGVLAPARGRPVVRHVEGVDR